MRWDQLFGDLESQYDAMQSAELYGEVAERTRSEAASISLLDRLRGAVDGEVALELTQGSVRGRLQRVGRDCLLVGGADSPGQEEWLIPVHALTGVHRPGPWSAAAEGVIAGRLGFRHLLRGIARARSPVVVQCLGLELAAGSLTGTIDRVGQDFFELAEHALDVPRRRGDVRGVRLVPFHATVAIRRR